MSLLYGLQSHKELGKLLQAHDSEPFCKCCSRKNNNDANDVLVKQGIQKFSRPLYKFLQTHHLSVHAIEHTVKTQQLSGRIDCIFLENVYKKTMYIVDWKFSKRIPQKISNDYKIQLNLYMHILTCIHEQQNQQYDYKLYCIVFSSPPHNKMKVFNVEKLPKDFIANTISILSM